jgi:RNA polymerase sigma factor (sigma-70 family)
MFAEAKKVTRDVHLAADAVQDAALRICAAEEDGTVIENEVAWVLEVTRNAARLILERRETAIRVLSEAAAAERPSRAQPQPWEILIDAESSARARELLADLPPELRKPLQMWAEDRLSYADISLRLGIPKSTVASRIQAACEQLNAKLTRG